MTDQKDALKLKDCPFCGSNAETDADSESHPHMPNPHYRIRCVSSDCPMPPPIYYFDTYIEAVKAWNTRSEDSTLKARVEKLREALARIDKIQHSMPRLEHGAGEFYQARLSVAQDIASAALEADGGR